MSSKYAISAVVMSIIGLFLLAEVNLQFCLTNTEDEAFNLEVETYCDEIGESFCFQFDSSFSGDNSSGSNDLIKRCFHPAICGVQKNIQKYFQPAAYTSLTILYCSLKITFS